MTFEAEYKEGLKNGKFNKYYDDGKARLISNYSKDLLHGAKKIYDEKGQIEETFFENGTRR